MKIEGVVYRPLKAAKRLRAPHSLVSRHEKTSSVVWNFLKFARRVFRVSNTCRIRAAHGTCDLIEIAGRTWSGRRDSNPRPRPWQRCSPTSICETNEIRV